MRLAVDVRLVDDVRKWPELARLSTTIVDRIRQTSQTRRRVYDELSAEERLLHAVAQALGGELDDREARTIHDQTSDTDRDVPFVAIVLASRGFDTERARSVYLLALEDRLSPALEESLRMAFERGFPAARAERLPGRVRQKLLARWPDTTWSRLVRALSSSDHELAQLAIEQPQLATTAGPRAIEVLAAHARWRRLLERLDAGTVDDRRARLLLLAGAAAWRYPLPARTVGAAIASSGLASDPAAVQLALATGDSASAIQLARARELLPTDLEASFAHGLALLGGGVDDVRTLGMAMPALGTSNASQVGTIHAALFALELGDRAALRELSTPLGALRETAWGRVLLGRVYLGMGEPSLVEPLLFRDDGPVSALLRARALALIPAQRDTAIAWLRDLLLEYPGWSELRLRYGLALATTDPRRGVGILEEAPSEEAEDTAVLGPPTTSRALAQLAAGELARRAGRIGDVAMRVRVAMALAPASPAVARQATTIAVAIRDATLAREAHGRLKALAPSARVVARLGAALLELTGDVDRAMETYRSIDAWDRVLVLAARRGDREAALPALSELAESSSVAALHAVAVLAVRRDELELAAEALERAVTRRRDHGGLAADYVAVRLALAQRVLAEGDVADLFYASRQLERAAILVDDARLRAARANIVVAMTAQWVRLGEHERAETHLAELRDELDPKRDAAARALVGAHLAAIALRDHRPDDAATELDRLPETDHVRFLTALHAYYVGEADRIDERLPALARSPLAAIRAGARILETLDAEDTDAALAAYALSAPVGEGPEALDVDVAIHVVYQLADGNVAHADLASYMERVASWTTDADGARRARLVALGLRATAPEPERTDIETLDLGQLVLADEREFAIGLIALEVRRRRAAEDKAAAQQALSQLVMLVRPSGAVGVLALASIEEAAEAALVEWRADPELTDTLQTALATQLKVALSRELGDRGHAECVASWHNVVGLLAPVLVTQSIWSDFSTEREDVYEVPYLDLDGARAACQRRVDDILVALGKWHAARGKDAAASVARIEGVRHVLATELSIARTVGTLVETYDLADTFPQALGPIGLDLLGRRAEAIDALGELTRPEYEHATAAADVRGILAGALLDGWVALHDGRLDVAEQVARDRIASMGGRAETEAIRLLAALYIRRIREAMEENDLNGAGEIASEWVTREHLPELPDELADEIANVCRGIYDRYGLGPARRRLQQIRGRAGHDTRTLREVEAELILRYLDRGRAADAMDGTRLLVEAMKLSPSESTRTRLRDQLATTLAAQKDLEPIDELISLLAGKPELVDCVVAAQVRKSELGDRRLRSSAALEARVEELRRLIDTGRSASAPLARLLDRMVFLHERLQQVYETAGNPHEAQRHQRRAAAYRNWHAGNESPP